MNNIRFGMNIARLRKENGLTQKELANKLHVTDKAISRWERGAGFPDISSLCPLAEALGVTVAKLLDAEEEDDEGKEQAFLQVSGYLAEKEYKLSRLKLKIASIVLALLILTTLVFGYKYFKWHYEDTIVVDWIVGLPGEVRLKKVIGYRLIGDGMYSEGEEYYIVVDIDEKYGY